MLEGEPEREIWGFLEARFGVPTELRKGYTLWERGRTCWILSDAASSLEGLTALKVASVGIPLVRRISHWLKPTTAGLRLLGPWIRSNRILLEAHMARELLSKGDITWTDDASEGYVLLETDGGVLGCGLMLGGRLRSQIPRSEVRVLNLES